MIWNFFKTYGYFLLLIWAVLLWCRRFAPFVLQEIPLGYDPGLYKVMMEQYMSLSSWDFSKLDQWLLKMYPPFLGMLTGIISFIWATPERLLTRGIGCMSLCVWMGIYVLIKQVTDDRVSAVIWLILFMGSFVHWFVFWWGYWKQLLATFLLLMVLWLRSKHRFQLSLPITCCLGAHA